MKAILAADQNWGIGYQNRLLASIPADMKFFRTTTTGNVVIMGRKTLESFPGGRPLKNRVNLVLTSDKNYEKEGAVILHSLEELQEEIRKYPAEQLYVIGGGSVYRQLLPLCDQVLVTRIFESYEADTWFPDLDALPDWVVAEEGEMQEHEGIRFVFRTYARKQKDR